VVISPERVWLRRHFYTELGVGTVPFVADAATLKANAISTVPEGLAVIPEARLRIEKIGMERLGHALIAAA